MAVSTAYVLAAGLGTRLRPLTTLRCKPLVEVCGMPLIAYTLRLLEDAGITQVGINSHWLHPQLPSTLGGTGAKWGSLTLTFTHEPEVLGTGGGLKGLAQALPAPPGEKVLVMNADALIDLDVAALIASDTPTSLATLVLQETPDVAKYGAIGTDVDDRITAFAKKLDPIGTVVRERMFCGVHLVDPRAFELLPAVTVDNGTARGKLSGINDDAYPEWMKRGEILRAFDLPSLEKGGTFCDVGTPERLLEANLAILDGTWPSQHLRPFAKLEARNDFPGARVFVAPDAIVEGEVIGPALIAAGARVEKGARVERSVVGAGAVVSANARVKESVLQSGALATGDVNRTIAWRNGSLRV